VAAVVGNAERAKILDGCGAAEIVTSIGEAQGRFPLILEAAGGASLTAAIERVEPKGVVVIYGNSSGEPTLLDFRMFGEHQNARLQGFHYFTCEPEEKFGSDLALLVSLVADGSLKPRIVEHDWHDIPAVGARLLGRGISGKAIFRIPQN
jgi:NADPH2:quinone reductase